MKFINKEGVIRSIEAPSKLKKFQNSPQWTEYKTKTVAEKEVKKVTKKKTTKKASK